ncbi:lipocalin family protein [Variovorax sp. CY25R-8]|uniref:lipocalin family protein n=1 Tax=Variovorax sp. CY25R-8 TaxID=2855501 RepID=UPI0021BA9871|nr:lipocalin family protein [Variovorax sp. CY25R-8]MCT8175614.1 lipocalin family protein [Variovorax sp. CY25R-8]
MQRTRLVASMIAGAALLAACGGGGGGGGASFVPLPPAANNPPPETPVPPEVQAAQPKLSNTPMDEIVSSHLLPTIERLFAQVRAQKLDTVLLGQKVFAPGSKDKFLPGKVAIGFSYILLNTPSSDPKYREYIDGYREIADATIDVTNDSWGIYYYMSALWKLKKAGLLEGSGAAISPATLDKLKTKLNWTAFVDPADYSLIGLPTNYYGVAFSIARLRHLMGWEGPEASEALLQKMINHYKTFSAFGFSDETDGSGRFDRYSVLLIGEIMQRLIETGMTVSAEDEASLKGWLRQSVDVIKVRLNPAGNGVDYGRSLAGYADTAFAEVLSAAEHMNVLNEEEKQIAYAFATRVTAKYVEFWYDAELGSLNMWQKGRRVDSYRGIDRVLGENLSLSHQLIYTNNLWKSAGYAQKAPVSTQTFLAYLDRQPRATLTKFAGFDGAASTYDRGLVTYRDGLRVISLPVVNGAKTYHHTNPYFAIPHSYNMLSGVADTQWPQLQPRFTVATGSQPLIPAAYQKNLKIAEAGQVLTVSYDQDAMDRATSGNDPIKDPRITSSTRYTFEPGRITRVDTYTPAAALDIAKLELEFGSYSDGARALGGNRFAFANGDVQGFAVEGLQDCAAVDVRENLDYNTPTGALKTSIRCSTPAFSLAAPLTIKWVLEYRSPSVAGIAPK